MSEDQTPIRAVLWDMGGVIVRTLDWSGRARWEKKLGMQPHELERLVFRGEMGVQASLGKAEVDDVWRWVGQQLGLPENARDQLRKDFFGSDRVDEVLVAYIRKLKTNFKTGMISNAWPDLRYWLKERWNIADAFDQIVVSAEVGLTKPDPRIYQMALDALQVVASESVFIDDFEVNIVGARSVGMHAIHFRDRTQILSDLEDLLSQSQDTIEAFSS